LTKLLEVLDNIKLQNIAEVNFSLWL
jgi:hypothetical protein